MILLMDLNVVINIYSRKKDSFSLTILELKFQKERSEWKLKLIPIEIIKIDSEKFIYRLLYKNHYVPNKIIM